MDEPLISVIVPTYNGERYIADALDSIFAQKYPQLEVIVVNDGSTDGTEAILESYASRIRVISQQNAGPAAARNAGMCEAKGAIIGFLDADDVWPEGRTRLLLPYLVRGGHDIVRGFTKFFKDTGAGREFTEAMRTDMLVGSALYTRSFVDRVGPFDERMRYGEDVDWSARMVEAGMNMKQVEDVVLLYRRHEHNITNVKHAAKSGLVDALRRRMERRSNKSA